MWMVECNEFQFLQGLIKTLIDSIQHKLAEEFQFLQGLIKTAEIIQREVLKDTFQFLQGLIKTQQKNFVTILIVVSIPTRSD